MTSINQSKIDTVISALEKPGAPDNLNPESLDKIFQAILPAFNSCIANYAFTITNSITEVNSFTIASTRAKIESTIKRALNTYLFVTKRWQRRVPLRPYIYAALKNLALNEKNAAQATIFVKRFACPVCREFSVRSQLVELSENKLTCNVCSKFTLEYATNTDEYIKQRVRLSNMFFQHSKKGVRCPRCSRFVPFSLKVDNVLTCPFDGCGVDCSNEPPSKHPTGSFLLDIKSLDEDVGGFKKDKPITIGDRLSDKKNKRVDCSLEQMETIKATAASIRDIVISQKNVNGKTRESPNKSVMYDSIVNILDKYPVESVGFLAKKQHIDMPMQALIYQEFSKNMINILPISFRSNNCNVNIVDPLDPRLKLFTGIHSFSAKIGNNLVIKKPTILLKNKHNGSKPDDPESSYTFIGLLINILDEDNVDLSSCIDLYSFVNIKLKPNSLVVPGKDVHVKYFAIPAHYSMQSMAHMRRIMKKIHSSCVHRNI